jgi:hypothetical protein
LPTFKELLRAAFQCSVDLEWQLDEFVTTTEELKPTQDCSKQKKSRAETPSLWTATRTCDLWGIKSAIYTDSCNASPVRTCNAGQFRVRFSPTSVLQ